MRVDMTIQELIRKMQSVRADSGAVLDRALLKGGEKVRGKAVLLCPVDTGELRNSIRVQRISPEWLRSAPTRSMQYLWNTAPAPWATREYPTPQR